MRARRAAVFFLPAGTARALTGPAGSRDRSPSVYILSYLTLAFTPLIAASDRACARILRLSSCPVWRRHRRYACRAASFEIRTVRGDLRDNRIQPVISGETPQGLPKRNRVKFGVVDCVRLRDWFSFQGNVGFHRGSKKYFFFSLKTLHGN